MKRICILTPVKNEESNIEVFIEAVIEQVSTIKDYSFEHILIDNSSEDSTQEIIIRLTEKYTHLGAIFNLRDFGVPRSQLYALQKMDADAVVLISADFQEPIELIREFILEWEKGHLIVGGVKESSEENAILYFIRKLYYSILHSISEVKPLKGYMGFALYDRKVINELKKIKDKIPYLRAIPTDLGFSVKTVPYHQPLRRKGNSKASLFVLFEMAILGITSYSKAPMRIASIIGFIASLICFCAGLTYFIYKLFNWNEFQLGIAPLIILISFGFSIQILLIGLIGEYVAKISSEVVDRPLVLEKERVNFPVKRALNFKK